MKTLIIAEKPNQAKEYAKALGGFTTKNGYLENEKYYISWCFGHMISLEKDDKYRPDGPWSKTYLPLIPEKYYYKIGADSTGKTDSGKKKQIDLIKSLIKNSSQIINATDADREGELIFLYVYNYLECKLPYKRLWISSLTTNDIQKGFQNLLNSNDVYHLGKSAYARAIADWLVGVNGTQASTLQFGNGKLLPIGRVQTAILKIICERFLKNQNFKKTFTYKIRANHKELGIDFFSETPIYENKTGAESILKTLNNIHKCIEVDKKTTKENPPLLFSIDTLIIEANKVYKYTGQETLNIAQSLYEKKLTSYPRTDSTYINEENFEKLKRFIPEFAKEILNQNFSFSVKPKSVNDKKLTGSHDAIVPTGEVPNFSSLSEKEINLYKLILSRTLQSFSDAAEYEKTKIIFQNNITLFSTYASTLLVEGWRKYILNNSIEKLQSEDQQELKLDIKKDALIEVIDFSIKEIESKPPALYSEVNLTADLTNFGKLLREENPELLKNIKENIDIDSLQIGTQATRPGIIERLKALGFINLKNNKFIPTEDGLKYYNIFKNLQVSDVVTTAIWEMKLKKVAEAKEDIREFYKEITSFTTSMVNDIFSKSTEIAFEKEKKETLGICPKCKKGEIYAGKMAYNCSEYKNNCNFSIWKILAKKKLTEKNIKDLITTNKTNEIKGFKNKKGESFSAKLIINKEFKIEFVFK